MRRDINRHSHSQEQNCFQNVVHFDRSENEFQRLNNVTNSLLFIPVFFNICYVSGEIWLGKKILFYFSSANEMSSDKMTNRLLLNKVIRGFFFAQTTRIEN